MKGSLGCKEQLIVDTIFMKQANKYARNLHTAFIDYAKAYNSVPHSWLVKILQLYKVDETLVEFLKYTMKRWETKVMMTTKGSQIEIPNVKICKGVFQGDTLSPLWFCMALNPLSNILNETDCGYEIRNKNERGKKITHLFYMDDLKLYAKSEKEMKNMIKQVTEFSNDIKMGLGIDKCKTMAVKKRKQGYYDEPIITNEEEKVMKALSSGETYKYLGMEQSRMTEVGIIKDRLKKEFEKRLHLLCGSGLNGKNMIEAVNTYATPVLVYSFGVIHWSDTEMEELQRITRKVLTKYRHHHPKAAVERTMIARIDGGRGIIDVMELRDRQIHNMRGNIFIGEWKKMRLYRR